MSTHVRSSMYTTLHLNFNPVNLQHSNCNEAFSVRVENRVGPDLMAASDFDLQCFQKRITPCSALQALIVKMKVLTQKSSILGIP